MSGISTARIADIGKIRPNGYVMKESLKNSRRCRLAFEEPESSMKATVSFTFADFISLS